MTTNQAILVQYNITQPCNIVQFTSFRERFLCPLLWFEKKAPKVFCHCYVQV